MKLTPELIFDPIWMVFVKEKPMWPFKWKPSNSTACAVQRGSDVQVCIKPEFNHLKM